MDILESRQAILDSLKSTGQKVYPTNPEKFVPPCAVLWLGSPFLFDSEESGFGETGIRWEVDLIAPKGSNESETDHLLRNIGKTYRALAESGFSVESTSQPVMLAAGNARYLSATLSVVGNVELEG